MNSNTEQKPRMLAVDDEPLNLEIIGEFLSEEDYLLDFASGGEEAWSLLESANPPFDLLILDRMMPGLDGMGLLRRVKEDGRLRKLPVIMQTAAASPEQVREGLEAGAYYYLTKPYEPAALLAIVRTALEHVREREALERQSKFPPSALACLVDARFAFRTLEEARDTSLFLAGLCPSPEEAALGLSELLINAVEHGNLGLSYDEKKRLRQEGDWMGEVEARLARPEYRALRAEARVQHVDGRLVFTIQDQGKGFDWRRFMEFDPERAYDPNGRGIAMARQISFSSLEYQGNGSTVVACVGPKAAPEEDLS